MAILKSRCRTLGSGIFYIFQPIQKGWCYSQAQKTCNEKRRTSIRSAAFLLSEQHYGESAGVFCTTGRALRIHRIENGLLIGSCLRTQTDQLLDLAMREDIELILFHRLDRHFRNIGRLNLAFLNRSLGQLSAL